MRGIKREACTCSFNEASTFSRNVSSVANIPLLLDLDRYSALSSVTYLVECLTGV